MEQQRKAYWYTVIQYCPDTIRGEKMNVGVFLHCPEEGSLYHSLLDEGNAKLRYFLQTDVNIRTFRIHRDLIDFSLKKLLSSENRLVGPNHYDRKFLFDLPNEFPTEFFFSEPTFALTRNVDILFESLQKTYLGDVFSKNLLGQEPSVDHEYIRSVKVYTRDRFSLKNSG